MSDAPPTCPRCGRDRGASAPAGLCPYCLMEAALGGPTGAEVAPAPGAVLETLAATCGPMPQVLLQNTADDSETSPLVRPFSPAMPAPHVRPSRLQLLGEIARGGMGVILKGRDPDLGRDLAVKVLGEAYRDRPEMVRRFVEEAQIAGQLQHPGIVPVYELGCFADGRPYFTMKLVKGGTLAEALVDRPTVAASRSRLLDVFEQVAQTMAYAHARGVIHRDLKPSNVMVGAFGEVQVMDWGLAKVLPRGGAADDAGAGVSAPPPQETVIATARSGSGSDSDLSRAGSVLGTPSYMAPEQARGEVEAVNERADVFALGSILCEILTGKPAFSGRTSGEIQRKAARGDLADASTRLDASGADAELIELARDCLAAEPADRPREAGFVAVRVTVYLTGVRERLHAAELGRAAEAARAEEATRTAEAANARARAEARARRLTAALAASVLCLVGVGGGGAAWLQRQHSARSEATARAVDAALGEASRLQGEANAAADGDPARWGAALAEARRAEALLKQGEADAFLRGQVADRVAALTRRRDEAERRATRTRVERELLEALRRARDDNYQSDSLERAEAGYAAAFRAAGMDVDRAEPRDVGAWVAARPSPTEVVAFLDDWANIRRRFGPKAGRKAWSHLVAAARAADPDPWRDQLRAGMIDDPAALRALADDERGLEGRSVLSLNLLGMALRDTAKDVERAERVFRLTWLRYPNDYWVLLQLGQILTSRKPDGGEALTRWRADRLRFLTALATLRPDGPGLYSLSEELKAQGRREDASVAFQEAMRRRPDYYDMRSTIATVPSKSVENDPALAPLREAVRRVGGAVERFNLAAALDNRGELQKALVLYQEAVRLDGPRLGEAIFNLGHLLRRLGRYDEAADAFARARVLALAANRPDQVRRSDDFAAFVASQKALAARAPAVLAGTDVLLDTDELRDILQSCVERHLFALGARVCEAAYKTNPKLADAPSLLPRYHAACLAAMAASGEGDDPPQGPAERAHLRGLALGWLRGLLPALSKRLDGATPVDLSGVGHWLGLWRADPDLASVRRPLELAKLPAPEREAWQSLWAEVDALRARGGTASP